jgi:hypothetical protein
VPAPLLQPSSSIIPSFNRSIAPLLFINLKTAEPPSPMNILVKYTPGCKGPQPSCRREYRTARESTNMSAFCLCQLTTPHRIPRRGWVCPSPPNPQRRWACARGTRPCSQPRCRKTGRNRPVRVSYCRAPRCWLAPRRLLVLDPRWRAHVASRFWTAGVALVTADCKELARF